MSDSPTDVGPELILARPILAPYRAISLPLWFGRLIIKHKRHSLFSERYRCVPTVVVGPLRITWRTYRQVDAPRH